MTAIGATAAGARTSGSAVCRPNPRAPAAFLREVSEDLERLVRGAA